MVGTAIPNFSLIPNLFEIGKFFFVDAIPAGNGTDLTDMYRERAYDTHCSLVPSLEGCKSGVPVIGNSGQGQKVHRLNPYVILMQFYGRPFFFSRRR